MGKGKQSVMYDSNNQFDFVNSFPRTNTKHASNLPLIAMLPFYNFLEPL